MTRPLQAIIDTGALRHNLDVLRQQAAHSRILAVIKANAYGHGLAIAADALAQADGFAVASLEEALQLRQLGVECTILLLEGVFEASEILACSEHRLAMVIHRHEQIEWLRAARLKQPVEIFLKLNSGMNRLGFTPETYHQAMAEVRAIAAVSHITQTSHFASADEADGIEAQMAVIHAAFSAHAHPASLANSAAVFRYPESHRDWVRPGISLYGGSPFADTPAETLGLRPVMTLHSRIIAVQTLQPGQALGYGGDWVAQHPTRIGVVACGYADGYPRHAGTGTPILVNGQRTRTLGRVSMDMLFADLSCVQGAQCGSPVTLWGDGLPVEQVAQAAGTINYELLCARAQRVPERII
ncbi:MAG: alanine racemase [Betaproteobacteria bacterium]|nr:alanine racemase [Betaproteobacteria bacterium]